MTTRHVPVLLREVVQTLLKPQSAAVAAAQTRRRVFLDATFGYGGYTKALLDADKDCVVVAIDRDPLAIQRAAELRESPSYINRLIPVHCRFSEALRSIPLNDIQHNGTSLASTPPDIAAPDINGDMRVFDGIAVDLGVSSMQLDDPSRGFSYQSDGPLDMRMSGTQHHHFTAASPTAADLINTLPAYELERIIREYGEERLAGRITEAIVRRRQLRPFSRTGDLAAVVCNEITAFGATGANRQKQKQKQKQQVCRHRLGTAGHPAARTFQALRIAVNDELNEIKQGMRQFIEMLADEGRLAVVSFHGLEDGLVKQAIKQHSSMSMLTKHVIRPQPDELAMNPRSRSAMLRAAVRTGGSDV